MELKRVSINAYFLGLALLIVPYGIETIQQYGSRVPWYLLIVPYGIETSSIQKKRTECYPFNRTLWN